MLAGIIPFRQVIFQICGHEGGEIPIVHLGRGLIISNSRPDFVLGLMKTNIRMDGGSRAETFHFDLQERNNSQRDSNYADAYHNTRLSGGRCPMARL